MAAFALCNIIRGSGDAILVELFSLNIAPILATLIQSPNHDVLVEVVWILAYITTGSEPLVIHLADSGILLHLVRLLVSSVTPPSPSSSRLPSPSSPDHHIQQQPTPPSTQPYPNQSSPSTFQFTSPFPSAHSSAGSQHAFNFGNVPSTLPSSPTRSTSSSSAAPASSKADGSSSSFDLVVPLLRALGNMITRSENVAQRLMRSETSSILLDSIRYFLSSEHRGIRLEAVCVAGNLSSYPMFVPDLIARDTIPPLADILRTQALDMRREAGFALLNICDQHSTPSLVREVMPGFVRLVTCPDIDAIILGLNYIEWSLSRYPDVIRMLEEEEDLPDKLEKLVESHNERVSRQAGFILDEYCYKNDDGGGGGYSYDQNYNNDRDGDVDINDDDAPPPWRGRAEQI
eukprot:TRINITY_DN9420_c0_g1_i5.p1 TRINITY_DN9420_c0_g1~~TRINITY_DN9420_c0_g1_i5.p1  ORF type:complete len:425 (-),score=117.06 TRINITY_DN9420_c0_g1_i5:9-1217(-)